MKNIFIAADHIVSPLGFSTKANLDSIRNNHTGIEKHVDKKIAEEAFYASRIGDGDLTEAFSEIGNPLDYMKLEQMFLLAVHGILSGSPKLDLEKTILIISTTKGNIDVLGTDLKFPKEKAKLYSLGKTIKDFFKLKNEPITISNACISGGLAIVVGKRLLQAGRYENAIVVGGDIVSKFTFSGFKSLQAISEKPCSPFSEKNVGITLGEAAAAVLLKSANPKNLVSSQNSKQGFIAIVGDSTANDANHISGPSRTGEGLFIAIQHALKEAKIKPEEVDLISPHGTGTLYNDQMESIAFERASLTEIPVNALKGFYGHTLGASALVETIVAARSLQNGELFPSAGFDPGNVEGDLLKLNITTENKKSNMQTLLKTASGFGGCNLAMVLRKYA